MKHGWKSGCLDGRKWTLLAGNMDDFRTGLPAHCVGTSMVVKVYTSSCICIEFCNSTYMYTCNFSIITARCNPTVYIIHVYMVHVHVYIYIHVCTRTCMCRSDFEFFVRIHVYPGLYREEWILFLLSTPPNLFPLTLWVLGGLGGLDSPLVLYSTALDTVLYIASEKSSIRVL